MKATCCICSDGFDEVHPISTTSCGHVYHTNCLMSWIGQRKTCPICRTQLNSPEVLRLYFNFNTSNVPSISDLEDEISDLKSRLKAKDLVLRDSEKEKEQFKVAAKEAEKKSSDLQQLLNKCQSEGEQMKLKINTLSMMEVKVGKLEKMNSALTHNLQILNDVRSMVTGSKKEVDEILEKMGDGPFAPKMLATYVQVMKLGLLDALDDKKELQELNRQLKLVNRRFTVPVEQSSTATAGPSGNQDYAEDNSSPQRETFSRSTSAPHKETLSGSNSAFGSKYPTKRIRQNEILTTPYFQTIPQFLVNPTSQTATVTNSSINTVTSVPVLGSTAPKSHNCVCRSLTYGVPAEVVAISPVPFPNLRRFNMSIGSTSTSSNRHERHGITETVQNIPNQNFDTSVIRNGYNGLGGHSNFINVSESSNMRNLKRKQ